MSLQEILAEAVKFRGNGKRPNITTRLILRWVAMRLTSEEFTEFLRKYHEKRLEESQARTLEKSCQRRQDPGQRSPSEPEYKLRRFEFVR